MSAPLREPPRRILVVKLGHIGDVLVTTPLLRVLHDAYPASRITALVNQGTEAMLAHHPLVDRLLVLQREKTGAWQGLRRQAGLLAAVAGGGFDLALDLSGGDRGAFLVWLSRAGVRVGFQPKRPHFRARAFHRLVDGRGTRNHVIETLLRPAAALGLATDPPPPLEFYPGAEAEGRARDILAAHDLTPGGYALVHPTSRWMFKTWTPEGNARVLAHLAAQGLRLVLSAAPAPAEMEFVARLKAALPADLKVVDLAGQLDLPRLGALLASARLFFGVDSAPMHLAAALGVPTVVLFGPSGEKMWGPWQTPSEVVTLEMACRPCGRDGCEGSKVSRCLVGLAPEMVCGAVDRLLARTGDHAHRASQI
ncbi:MAG: putative lipopolysaccharide heptosyltransferase III [Deltaproteobacteria bacterium]|nr:putative lipopolysaccharide heptosyltransferase III [Deltaproteobacteria bacterium]